MAKRYRQCSLRGLAGEIEVAWIPSEFAREGKRLKIDGLSGLWTVEETYGATDFENLLEARKEQKAFAGVLEDH